MKGCDQTVCVVSERLPTAQHVGAAREDEQDARDDNQEAAASAGGIGAVGAGRPRVAEETAAAQPWTTITHVTYLPCQVKRVAAVAAFTCPEQARCCLLSKPARRHAPVRPIRASARRAARRSDDRKGFRAGWRRRSFAAFLPRTRPPGAGHNRRTSSERRRYGRPPIPAGGRKTALESEQTSRDARPPTLRAGDKRPCPRPGARPVFAGWRPRLMRPAPPSH